MTKSIIFDILAIDSASPTFSKVGMAAGTMGSKVQSAGAYASKGFLVAGVAAAALGIKSIKMAGDFDAAIVRLETTAGESHAALGQVSKGLLDMAGKVGFTAQELATGMYTVESAGYHGAAGLQVMSAASKGARVEGANLTTVVDAVSSLLVDYHLKADQSARVTNILTAAVGHGKTTFEQMAGALPNVAAAGATAKISMAELASAIATMTMHGTDASKAGTYLRQVIGQLEAPSAKARTVMKGLGIDANQLGLTLSSGSGHGLADAIKMVDDAIATHLTPAGLVAINTFRNSKNATSAYQKVLADLPPSLTTSFGALTQMVGGVKSLQGFLQLGGENLKTYKSNVKAVRDQVKAGGTDVEGFAQQQATLNGKLNDAKGATSALAVEIGHNLTPAAMAVVGAFATFATTLQGHDHAVTVAVVGLSALAAAVMVVKVATAAAAVTTALLGGAEVTLALRMAATALVTGDLTGAMAAMSMAMDANPVGLVIIAIAALAAGLIIAYKKSDTFRAVVTAAFHAVATAGAWMWNNVLQPAFRLLLSAIAFVMEGWSRMLGALGHIPGFGWAKDASRAMGNAADAALRIRDSINKIPDHKDVKVNVAVVMTGKQKNAVAGLPIYQTGGKVGNNATGTPNWRGGLTWVGEQGPELMNLPSGTRIWDAQESVRMATAGRSSGGGGGGSDDLGTLTVVVKSETGEVIEQKLVKVKRKRGGRALAFV
jgi:TP901 family phage tail tape measure protein